MGLVKKVSADPREITPLQLHDFGCTLDETELPHHISSPEQVAALQSAFRDVLEQLPKPTIITIARYIIVVLKVPFQT